MLEGRCKGRVIHLGSCESMKGAKRDFDRFLRQTNAVAVCGYADEVDWVTSAAFEIVLFAQLQENAFQRNGLAAAKRRLTPFAKPFGTKGQSFSFRMFVHPGA